jgi:hypothetical protein
VRGDELDKLNGKRSALKPWDCVGRGRLQVYYSINAGRSRQCNWSSNRPSYYVTYGMASAIACRKQAAPDRDTMVAHSPDQVYVYRADWGGTRLCNPTK